MPKRELPMTSIFDQFERRETGFDDVDKTSISGAFPEYLERMATDLAAVKRALHRLLDPRPGQRILDVGCGTGVDVLAVAEHVGPDGYVVGMDNSTVMVDAARKQAAERGLPAEFVVGDAHEPAFPDDTFDSTRSERVLQHVADPSRVVAELVRVTKPGGTVLVADLDHGMWAPDAEDRETTRTVLAHWFDYIANPWVARQGPRLLRAAGVKDVQVTVLPVVMTALEAADAMTGLGRAAKLLAAEGAISAEQAQAWDDDLRRRQEEGLFFMCGAMLVAYGRV
ncbi:methyltransferase domain-containing protein [Actinoallomurus acanthiterrae]